MNDWKAMIKLPLLAGLAAGLLVACSSNGGGTGTAVEGGGETVTSTTRIEMLEVGKRAPDFEVKDEAGNTVKLSDFRGEDNVVLIFYPKDFTPGCTKQLCTARDDSAQYEAVDAQVFGVNPGDAESHKNFREEYDLPFPLLVDEDSEIAQAYGCAGMSGMVNRTVYAIDKRGRIAFAERGMPSTEAITSALQ